MDKSKKIMLKIFLISHLPLRAQKKNQASKQ